MEELLSGAELRETPQPRRSPELRRTLDATQAAIEAFCWDFQQWLGNEVTSRDAFASELLLREALVNAIEHGCGGQGNLQCVVRGGRGRVFIFVADGGPGFDWKPHWHGFTSVDACSGRGVMIYKTYAHQVRFNRAGNQVFLLLRLDGDNKSQTGKARQQMTIIQENGMAPMVLRVDHDVVASNSAALRDRLRQVVAEGVRSVTLDFADVRMVDSAGLGMLIAAHNSLKKVDGELIVTNCSSDILELFCSMRIHQHMKIEGAGVTAA